MDAGEHRRERERVGVRGGAGASARRGNSRDDDVVRGSNVHSLVVVDGRVYVASDLATVDSTNVSEEGSVRVEASVDGRGTEHTRRR